MRISVRTRIAIILSASVILGVVLAVVRDVPAPPQAEASTGQIAMFEEDVGLFTNPVGTLRTLRSLGVGLVRVSLRWNEIAPSSASPTKPSGFNAGDPGAYPGANWARYDRIVQEAQKAGIGVEFLVSGAAPLWAAGSGSPGPQYTPVWKPSASEYGQFMRAIATRYNGTYRSCTSCSALPRVRYWEIWNEPNWGQTLAPQEQGGLSVSARVYRGLLDAGWSALQATGHGSDTILMGSLSPRGWPHPGVHLTTKPLQFIRTLYCVDSSYHQLSGGAASAIGCPGTAAESAGFRSAHPALFGATGFGIHPYPFNLPPTQADSSDRDFVEFSQIPRMTTALDRVQRVYGSHRRLQIFNTEYGYETNPPNHSNHFVSPATAATYINWAEYLSWRNPRIATFMQFLLYDPNPRQGTATFGLGGFASGLIFYNGRPKADYYAYRMPIFLPVSTARRGHRLEVWGCLRPAHYARIDTHGAAQRVQIQFRRGAHGSFRTAKTVLITNARGYFDTRSTFPASGAVRLAWAYPSGSKIYSRTVSIRIR
jgi:hypothetical protein